MLLDVPTNNFTHPQTVTPEMFWLLNDILVATLGTSWVVDILTDRCPYCIVEWPRLGTVGLVKFGAQTEPWKLVQLQGSTKTIIRNAKLDCNQNYACLLNNGLEVEGLVIAKCPIENSHVTFFGWYLIPRAHPMAWRFRPEIAFHRGLYLCLTVNRRLLIPLQAEMPSLARNLPTQKILVD